MGDRFNSVFHGVPNAGWTALKPHNSDGFSYPTLDCPLFGYPTATASASPINNDSSVGAGWKPTALDPLTWLNAMVEMDSTARMSPEDDPWFDGAWNSLPADCDNTMAASLAYVVGPSVLFPHHGSHAGSWSEYSGELSGHALKLQMDQLTLLREARRVLDAKIEAARSQWSKNLEPLPTSVYRRAIVLYATLRNFVDRKTTKVLRSVRAMKRGMRRRQQRVRTRFMQSERIWYLLHGTHPPETQPSFNAEFLLRRGAA